MDCPSCNRKLRLEKRSDGETVYTCKPSCGYSVYRCFGGGNHEQNCIQCEEEDLCMEAICGRVDDDRKRSSNIKGFKAMALLTLLATLVFLLLKVF